MDREEATRALELLTRVVRQAKDDTAVQNWGGVWMLHGVTNGLAFAATDVMLARGHHSPLPYVLLWGTLVITNLSLVFAMKVQRGGVRSFVENQIWAIWTAFVVLMAATAIVNWTMGLHVLFMPPVAALLTAMAFCSMGAVIHGAWYGLAAVFLLASVGIAALPSHGFLAFALLWSVTQVGSGLVLARQRRRRLAAVSEEPRLV